MGPNGIVMGPSGLLFCPSGLKFGPNELLLGSRRHSMVLVDSYWTPIES